MTGHAQSYLQRTDVPSVFIETENRRAITSKEQYVNSTLIYVDGGTTTRYENTQIRGRGNSTWWSSDKKAYRIKFDSKELFLGEGFANAKSWTFLANHGDDDKMHFGPLWDLDLGYDNSSERSLLRQMEAYLGLWNRPFEKILQRLRSSGDNTIAKRNIHQ